MADKTFAEKMIAVMGDVGAAGKDGWNKKQEYAFTSAAGLQIKVQKAFIRHGLYLANVSYNVASESTFKTNSGSEWARAVVSCSLTVTNSEGQGAAHSTGLGCGADPADKHVMKAQTAALKYALSALFLSALGDDPEADVATDEATSEESETSEEYIAIWRSLQAEKTITDVVISQWLTANGKHIRELEKEEQVAMWDTLKDVCGCGAVAKAAGRTAIVTVAVLQGLWKQHVMPSNYGKHNGDNA